MVVYSKIPIDAIVVTNQGILRPKNKKHFNEVLTQASLSNKQVFTVPEQATLAIDNNWVSLDDLPLGTPIENTLVEFFNPDKRFEEVCWCLGFLDGNYDYHRTARQLNFARLERRSTSLYRCVRLLNSKKINVAFTATNDFTRSYDDLVDELSNRTHVSNLYRLIEVDIYNLVSYLAGYIDSSGLNTKDKFYIDMPNEEKARYMQKLFRLININSGICKANSEYYLNIWSLDSTNKYIEAMLKQSSSINRATLNLAIRRNKTTLMSKTSLLTPCYLYEIPCEVEGLGPIVSIDGVKVKLLYTQSY